MSFYIYITDATYLLVMEARMQREKAKFEEDKTEAAKEQAKHLRISYERVITDLAFKRGADWAKSYLKAEEDSRKCVSCRYFTVTNYNKYKACEIINIDLAETNIDPQSFNCKMFERKI